MNLDGTVAVVTDGDTGLGRAITLALARAGAEAVVVTFSRSIAEAEAIAAEARRWAGRSRTIAVDVADDLQVRPMAARVLAELGRIDILVNSAGGAGGIAQSDLDGLTDEIWHDILDLNLLGAFHCTRAFAPALRRSGGMVVNISSVAGGGGDGSAIAYGAGRAAVLQLTRDLAVALAPEVRVNAVAPGPAVPETGPLRRSAGPEHVAQAVLGLLGMDLVTGEAIMVDGGRHVRY